MIERAASATEGFPYLLQLVGYYLVEESRGREEIDDVVLDRALAGARDDMCENVFQPTLSALSGKDIEFLRALAKSANDEGVGRLSDVADIMDRGNSYLQVYRRRLIDAGVLVSPRDGELQFVVPLLPEYLRG